MLYHNTYHTAYVQHLAMMRIYNCDFEGCNELPGRGQARTPRMQPRIHPGVPANYADHHHHLREPLCLVTTSAAQVRWMPQYQLPAGQRRLQQQSVDVYSISSEIDADDDASTDQEEYKVVIGPINMVLVLKYPCED
ncbi:hypothetical protein JTB14_015951 [Gonioctena quinquepunctata]|nr:hypothetical protein JTB14_015951 [Gonioctena quinquepunctata]